MINIKHKLLMYVACSLAFLVVALCFSIRAGILIPLAKEFDLSTQQLGEVMGVAFLGVALSMVATRRLMRFVKIKFLLGMSFILHLLGIVMTILASGYFSLWVATLMMGISNGCIEAICGGLITRLFSKRQNRYIHFYSWLLAGTILGGGIVFFFNQNEWSWHYQVATIAVPSLIYGFLFFYLRIPSVWIEEQPKEAMPWWNFLFKLRYLAILFAMMGMTLVIFFIFQWIDLLFYPLTDKTMLYLALMAGVMLVFGRLATLMRGHRSPTGLLTLSALMMSLGMYFFSKGQEEMLCYAVVVFGMGAGGLYPWMQRYIHTQFPQMDEKGNLLLHVVSLVVVAFYLSFMGEHYDTLLGHFLPISSDLTTFRKAEQGSIFAMLYTKAQLAVTPTLLHQIIQIPLGLSLLFGLLWYQEIKQRIFKKRTPPTLP